MAENARVVAGYDASPESKLAVTWAATVAQRRGRPLRVVTATGVDPSSPTAYRAGVAVESKRRADALAQEGAQIARETAEIDIESAGVEHEAVVALVKESQNAELLVIGNRGHGRVRGALLGTVAFSVAIHATCPIAVVRDSLRPLPSPEYPILAASDGSPASFAAVVEAARLCSETDATLKILVAYDAPSRAPQLVASYPADETSSDVWQRVEEEPGRDGRSTRQHQREAATIAQDAAAAAREKYPDVPIELIVAGGRAERAILDAAEGASVIVVGARGRGEFASLLLGSVSRDVIQHADCAVYIVR